MVVKRNLSRNRVLLSLAEVAVFFKFFGNIVKSYIFQRFFGRTAGGGVPAFELIVLRLPGFDLLAVQFSALDGL